MPEGAHEILGRRDEALAGLIARHGTLNPFDGGSSMTRSEATRSPNWCCTSWAQEISTGAR
jgi:hypothetical protein